MKHFFILCATLLAAAAPVMAQEEAPAEAPKAQWSTLSRPALKVSEFMFENWSKTGNSQIDITATFFGNYKVSHERYVWDNIVDLAYGYAWQDLDNSAAGARFETKRKSNDKIDLTSSISWKAYKDWGASFSANLKTQFGTGYEYKGIEDKEGTLVSQFMAPGYLTTALSFELKKPDWSVSLSFLTGKTTFVLSDDLIDSGYTYGVIQDKGFDPSDPNRTHTHAYFGLGSYIKAQYLKKDILPNLDLYARIELFYDYMKPKNMAWSDIEDFTKDPGTLTKPEGSEYKLSDGETWEELAGYNWLQRRVFETDLDFELKLDYRLASFISANFALNLKWDTDFNGLGKWGHMQVYQMAGLQLYFNWETPKVVKD